MTTGSSVVINITLSVGSVAEVVSVTADAPVVDMGKIDMGRNLTGQEIKNLPLTSRNPYNFALLQPGVTGFENTEFGVPRFSANGSLLRINYQMDGNTNDMVRVITIDPAVAAQVGLPAQPGVAPASQSVNFFLAKADGCLSDNHHVSFRVNVFQNNTRTTAAAAA